MFSTGSGLTTTGLCGGERWYELEFLRIPGKKLRMDFYRSEASGLEVPLGRFDSGPWNGGGGWAMDGSVARWVAVLFAVGRRFGGQNGVRAEEGGGLRRVRFGWRRAAWRGCLELRGGGSLTYAGLVTCRQ